MLHDHIHVRLKNREIESEEKKLFNNDEQVKIKLSSYDKEITKMSLAFLWLCDRESSL